MDKIIMLGKIKPYFDLYPPMPINLVDNFAVVPEETLQVLQLCSGYHLTPEQKLIAKQSGLELASLERIAVLDLVEDWEKKPELSDFAMCVRKAFLP